jgi:hypothetical protein
MKHYQPSTPRVALGIAAVALMAISIALSVILPAQIRSSGREHSTLAASLTGIATIPSITVVSAREPRVATVSMRAGDAAPQHGRSGEIASTAVVHMIQ